MEPESAHVVSAVSPNAAIAMQHHPGKIHQSFATPRCSVQCFNSITHPKALVRLNSIKDWRQGILLYKRKSDLNKKQKATINLMTSSQWHLGNRSKGSLGKLLKQRGWPPLAEVEKDSISIADKVAECLLPRRAGLFTEQKQMLQGRASALTQVSVVEALYILPVLLRDKGRPATTRAGNLVSAMVFPGGSGSGTRTTRWRMATSGMMKIGLTNLMMMLQPGNNRMMTPMRWTRTTKMVTAPTSLRRTTLTTSTRWSWTTIWGDLCDLPGRPSPDGKHESQPWLLPSGSRALQAAKGAKCASRHNGVHFFYISTSKSGPGMVCFVHFDFEMCFAPQRRALFLHLNFQKCSEHEVFSAFSLANVLRATTVCNFSSLIWPTGSAPAAL